MRLRPPLGPILIIVLLLAQTTLTSIDAQQDPALTNVGISGADYSVPRQPPTTVSPGDRFRAWYWVNNPNSQRLTVVLGLSIKAPNGQVFHDPSNDIPCELSPQSETICNRFFTVPSNAPAGTYDVIYGLWTADRSRQITQVSRSGWLVVQQPSLDVQPRVWSPTVRVGSSASQSFTVSAGGGTVRGVSVSMISGPSWITINPTSLGDIAAGQSKTFTLTVSPPSGAEGQHPYNIRIGSTNAGNVDISGTITVQQQQQFDFRVRIPEATKYVVAGSGTIYTVWVDLVSGGAQQVTLSVSGLPSGVTYAFGSSSGGQMWTGVPTFQVDLYINTPSSLPAGTYSFTVTGSGGGLTRSASASLVVQAGTLAGRIVSVDPTSVTANPGQSVSFNFVVENTGNVIADYQIYFSASSILGYVSGTITLNPGQQGTITLTGSIPSGANPGTYQVDVGFAMAYRGQGWQNIQRWGSVQITVQGPQPGYIVVMIVNNDDDPIDVYLYIDGQWKGSYFGRTPGSSTVTDPIPVEGNSNHEVKIVWQDPDTSSQYEKTRTVYVPEGRTLHLVLTIDPHAPPPAQKPDLRVVRVDLRPYREGNRYLQGESIAIYPTIVNEGSADASNFKVNWYVDDALIYSWSGWSLRAGESVSSLGVTWSTTPGTHVIRVVVDPDNVIDELDETDNQMSVNILVEAQPQCDFSVSVSPTSGSVQQGQSMTFTVTVGLVNCQTGLLAPVSLSLAGQHSSMTYSFEPSLGTPAFTSRLTISTSPSTPPGKYVLNVVGTSGGLTKSATIELSVTTPEQKHKLRISFPTIPVTIQTDLYVNGDSRRVAGGETLELTLRKGEKVTLRTDPVPGYYSVSWIFIEPDDLPPWNGERPLELIIDKDYSIAFIYMSVTEVEETTRVIKDTLISALGTSDAVRRIIEFVRDAGLKYGEGSISRAALMEMLKNYKLSLRVPYISTAVAVGFDLTMIYEVWERDDLTVEDKTLRIEGIVAGRAAAILSSVACLTVVGAAAAAAGVTTGAGAIVVSVAGPATCSYISEKVADKVREAWPSIRQAISATFDRIKSAIRGGLDIAYEWLALLYRRVVRVDAGSDVRILVIDQLGRRTGAVYEQGVWKVYEEIPGAYYSGVDSHPQTIILTQLAQTDHQYEIIVIGNQEGDYRLNLTAIGIEANPFTWSSTGRLKSGEQDVYTIKIALVEESNKATTKETQTTSTDHMTLVKVTVVKSTPATTETTQPPTTQVITTTVTRTIQTVTVTTIDVSTLLYIIGLSMAVTVALAILRRRYAGRKSQLIRVLPP